MEALDVKLASRQAVRENLSEQSRNLQMRRHRVSAVFWWSSNLLLATDFVSMLYLLPRDYSCAGTSTDSRIAIVPNYCR